MLRILLIRTMRLEKGNFRYNVRSSNSARTCWSSKCMNFALTWQRRKVKGRRDEQREIERCASQWHECQNGTWRTVWSEQQSVAYRIWLRTIKLRTIGRQAVNSEYRWIYKRSEETIQKCNREFRPNYWRKRTRFGQQEKGVSDKAQSENNYSPLMKAFENLIVAPGSGLSSSGRRPSALWQSGYQAIARKIEGRRFSADKRLNGSAPNWREYQIRLNDKQPYMIFSWI